MKHETYHPCQCCEYFAGYEDIETMDTLNRGRKLHVSIPICGRTAYTLALGRCGEFKKITTLRGR